MITSFALVALGALVGGPARLALSSLVGKVAGERFPWGTLIGNLLGCTAIGALAARIDADSPYWLLLATGVLGSFTTISSYAAQSLALLRDGAYARAATYVGASAIFGVGGAALGYAMAAP